MPQPNSNQPPRQRPSVAQHAKPHPRTVQKANGSQGSMGKRIALVVVVIAAIAAVGFLAFSAFAKPAESGSSSASGAQASAEAGSPASQGAASGEAAATAANGDNSSSNTQAAAQNGDLSWRDSDFAVDANRKDEWNYASNGRKVVYLTFDDGPSQNTQAVLDVLDKYGCKATFFVVGHNPDYFPMIKEAYDRGHTIGLHTLTHDYATVYSSQQAYFNDLDGIGKIVEEQIGYVPCFIRFPGGSSNGISANYTPGIMSALVNEVQARGYQYYDWNVSSGDGAEHNAGDLAWFSTEDAPDYDNIILLMHDSETKQTTVEALPKVIEYYQARGYSFEAIDRSTMVPHHGTSN